MAHGPNGATSSVLPSKSPKKANQGNTALLRANLSSHRLVILSEAKDLRGPQEILRFAQDDRWRDTLGFAGALESATALI